MAGENKEYAAWLRKQPCAMTGHGECLGALHVHHSPGHKGLGQRNHDDSGKPLCTLHHTQRHALSGPFRGMGKEALRDWERTTAERFRQLYLGLGPAAPF